MDNLHPINILLIAIFINLISQIYIKLIHKFSFLKSIKIGFTSGLAFIILMFFVNYKLTIMMKFEIIILYILSSYCYIVIINTPESSVRLKILFIINKKKISRKKLLKLYNNKVMFQLRLNKLIKSNTILKKQKNLYIRNQNVILLFYLFKILKKLYLGNKSKL